MRIKKKNSNLLLGILIITLIVFLNIVHLLFKLFNHSVWQKNQRLNLCIASTPSLIISFTPQDKNIIALILPENLEIELSQNYGKYPLSTLWRFSILENNNGLLYKQSLQKVLGIRLDAYWGLSNKENLKLAKTNREEIIKLFKENFNFPNILPFLFTNSKKINTNLSANDLLKIFFLTTSFDQNKLEIIDLKKFDVLDEKKLPDKSVILVLKQEIFDVLVEDKFLEKEVVSKSPAVSIRNSTNIPNLASNTARILKNAGFQIIEISNQEYNEKQNICFWKKDNTFYFSQKYLRTLLKCKIKKGNSLNADFLLYLTQEVY